MRKGKKEIKAIVFDIGGILTNSNKELVRKELSNKYGINEKELLTEILNLHEDFSLGFIDYNSYMNKICRTFNIQDSIKFAKDWEEIFEKHFSVNQELSELIRNLSKKYIICSLSNVTPFFEKIRIKKNVYKFIKIKFSSFEQGLKKPNQGFFQLFFEKTGFNPKDCIFIDDSSENISSAKNLGFNTILFRNNEQLIEDLIKLRVKT